eukprot:519665_1
MIPSSHSLCFISLRLVSWHNVHLIGRERQFYISILIHTYPSIKAANDRHIHVPCQNDFDSFALDRPTTFFPFILELKRTEEVDSIRIHHMHSATSNQSIIQSFNN